MTHRILVVDDEMVLREMLKDVLTDAGHDAKAATSAEEALKMVPEYNPDIIVSDVWMPGMDGHTFCQMARKISDASILMMSGVSSEISALQRKQSCADDILIKPFDVENFVERINALLEAREAGSEDSQDNEQRLLQIHRGLSDADKKLLLEEAERIASGVR